MFHLQAHEDPLIQTIDDLLEQYDPLGVILPKAGSPSETLLALTPLENTKKILRFAHNTRTLSSTTRTQDL